MDFECVFQSFQTEFFVLGIATFDRAIRHEEETKRYRQYYCVLIPNVKTIRFYEFISYVGESRYVIGKSNKIISLANFMLVMPTRYTDRLCFL